MRIRLALFLVPLLLLVAGLHFASPDTGVNLPLTTTAGVSATVALNFSEPVGLLTVTSAGTSTTYSDGNYQIQIIEASATKARSIIRVIATKLSRDAFQVNGFSMTVDVSRSSIAG